MLPGNFNNSHLPLAPPPTSNRIYPIPIPFDGSTLAYTQGVGVAVQLEGLVLEPIET